MKVENFIFDFDGTLVHLFRNYDFRKRKGEMTGRMALYGVKHGIDEGIFSAFDSVRADLKGNDRLMHEALIAADDILTRAELEALDSALPIDGAVDFLKDLIASGKPFAVATNNSPLVVEKWLQDNGIHGPIPIYGRIPAEPGLLKPSGWTVEKAALSLGTLSSAVMIGDDPRDRASSDDAGVPFIGIGTTLRKYERLKRECPDVITVRTFTELRAIFE